MQYHLLFQSLAQEELTRILTRRRGAAQSLVDLEQAGGIHKVLTTGAPMQPQTSCEGPDMDTRYCTRCLAASRAASPLQRGREQIGKKSGRMSRTKPYDGRIARLRSTSWVRTLLVVRFFSRIFSAIMLIAHSPCLSVLCLDPAKFRTNTNNFVETRAEPEAIQSRRNNANLVQVCNATQDPLAFYVSLSLSFLRTLYGREETNCRFFSLQG